jgi:hypothetical protein
MLEYDKSDASCAFAAAGDLGYRGIRGAVGLGYRFTVYKRTRPKKGSILLLFI